MTMKKINFILNNPNVDFIRMTIFSYNFMFNCLSKFAKIHALGTQFFLKKMNSLITKRRIVMFIYKK